MTGVDHQPEMTRCKRDRLVFGRMDLNMFNFEKKNLTGLDVERTFANQSLFPANYQRRTGL